MTRDYAPNHTIWALALGSLEDLGDGHLPEKFEALDVRQVERFAAVIRVRDGKRVRRFTLRLTEARG